MARISFGITSLALCVGLAGGVALGRQSAGDEVRRLHEIYYEYFANGQADRIASEIYYPNRMSFGANGVTVSGGADQVEAGFRQATESLKAQDYDHSELPNPSICTPNPGTTIISGKFFRYRTDGSVLAEAGQTYIYGQTDDGWRIHATISHGPNTIIGC